MARRTCPKRAAVTRTGVRGSTGSGRARSGGGDLCRGANRRRRFGERLAADDRRDAVSKTMRLGRISELPSARIRAGDRFAVAQQEAAR